MAPKIAAVDLFCGAGGLTYGFRKAGLPVIAGLDLDESCRYPLEKNNPDTIFVHRDITEQSAEEVRSWFPPGVARVLAGCAPCQPFSKYTLRRGPSDGRWRLLLEFLRIVKGVQPEVVSMENVPNLARRSHPAFTGFVDGLQELGYEVWFETVDCVSFGIPQKRERLILLAARGGPQRSQLQVRGRSRHRTVQDAIGHLPEIVAGNKPTSEEDSLHISSGLSQLNMRRIRATPEGGGWANWPARLRLECHKRDTGRYYGSVYGRMAWNDPAPTITTQCYGYGNGRFGHPDQHRAISLREAALLQTFPPRYSFMPTGHKPTFHNTGRHIGNAVPPRLATAIARTIIKLIAP